ncbi:MAG: hypothetical protein Q9223_005169, partial [Gallowayella weberi]
MPRGLDLPGYWYEDRRRSWSPLELDYHDSLYRHGSDRKRDLDYAPRHRDEGIRDRRARQHYDRVDPPQKILDGAAIARGALHGPTIREIRPQDNNLPGVRFIKESDGREYEYKHVKVIGVGGQG